MKTLTALIALPVLTMAATTAAHAQDTIIVPADRVVVPDTVKLREVPEVEYRYAVVNDRTVLVDPSTRTIVEVIE